MMSGFQRILVPTDFSPHANEAFRVAHDLAKVTGACLAVFHVSRPPAVVSDGDRLLSVPARADSIDAWDELRKMQANDSAVHVEHEVIVSEHPSASHILRILEDRGCDLIVMGTHGLTGLKHLMFGSVTEEIVRRAHCPVMVVKAPAHEAAAHTDASGAQPASRVAS